MPRYVDHEARRQDIVDATVGVLAERGMKGLSFRAVASLLGGSTTLVTRYYATQEELLTEAAISLTKKWDQEVRALDTQSSDPWERLRSLLIWLVPTTEDSRIAERARIQLLADELTGAAHREELKRYDRKIRHYLRNHLREVVPAHQVTDLVDFLRAATTGVVLSTLEHPHSWSAERQIAVVGQLLETVTSVTMAETSVATAAT